MTPKFLISRDLAQPREDPCAACGRGQTCPKPISPTTPSFVACPYLLAALSPYKLSAQGEAGPGRLSPQSPCMQTQAALKGDSGGRGRCPSPLATKLGREGKERSSHIGRNEWETRSHSRRRAGCLGWGVQGNNTDLLCPQSCLPSPRSPTTPAWPHQRTKPGRAAASPCAGAWPRRLPPDRGRLGSLWAVCFEKVRKQNIPGNPAVNARHGSQLQHL